jgi:hypothetical protein
MNIASYVHGFQSTKDVRCEVLIFMHNGAIIYGNVCGHGVWCIEWCPPNTTLKVLMCKKKKHDCITKIISTKIIIKIIVPYYDGWWFGFGGATFERHKFSLNCYDDLNCCVRDS